MKDVIKNLIEASIDVKKGLLKDQLGNIENAAEALIRAYRSGNKVLIFGNGGSAADSQHMAAELVGRFKKERPAIPAIALSTDTSALTALANDYGYATVFSRQVEALGKKGDVAFGISTSGNSENVIAAVRKAKSIGMKTISLTGCGGGELKKECEFSIVVDSKDTPRIQESHITIIHILCQMIEDALFGAK